MNLVNDKLTGSFARADISRMSGLLYLLGIASLAIGGLVSTQIRSDIQLILMAVLVVGGFNLIGLGAVLGRVSKAPPANKVMHPTRQEPTF